ncbi:hypothetical protein N431DRAFT_171491 [Stipitochalara longipes BDJ]|nr:hypothetical protein N431DRAFT_171491 [Stipitochalara longipes BDJ]
MAMSRPIYLVVYHSPLFAAHWALWIPYYESGKEQRKGKVIHIQGSASEGFAHEFKRNYDIIEDNRSKSTIILCWVDSNSAVIVDVYGDGTFSTDTSPADILEETSLRLPAPGPSLRSVLEPVTKSRVAVQNCQTWLLHLVTALVKNSVLPQEALEAMERSPKN